MHRHGQSPRALRVQMQGKYRHPRDLPNGGQFVLHAKALHGNPFDGHTLGPVVADTEKLTGVEARRIHVDKGYRGHSHPHRFRVWISGQVRRVTASIRREMKRRAAVEPVIGHVTTRDLNAFSKLNVLQMRSRPWRS